MLHLIDHHYSNTQTFTPGLVTNTLVTSQVKIDTLTNATLDWTYIVNNFDPATICLFLPSCKSTAYIASITVSPMSNFPEKYKTTAIFFSFIPHSLFKKSI